MNTGRMNDSQDEEVMSYQNDQAEDVLDNYGHSDDSEHDEESKAQARAGANPGGRYSKKTSSLILQQDKNKNPRSEISGKKQRHYGDSITTG